MTGTPLKGLVALILAVVVNLCGLILLASFSSAESEHEEASAPREKVTPAPELLPPQPPPRPQVKKTPSELLQRPQLAAPAPSQLPPLKTLLPSQNASLTIDPALEGSLDALFSDLSAQTGAGTEPGGLGTAQASPPDADRVRDASQVDQAPTVRRRVSPRYPLEAERAGVTGYVVLRGLVERDGRVSRVDVIDSSPAGVFDEAARSAFARWTFGVFY